MKIKYLLVAILAASLKAFGQTPTTDYQKKDIKSTDIQVLFSYYNQDGNRSAVTGGTGTEKLIVYGNEFLLNRQKDSLTTWSLGGGADVISSASTDNIDFARSSASIIDVRGHIKVGVQRVTPSSGWKWKANMAASIESDYTSIGGGLRFVHSKDDQSREWEAGIQAYYDDLRWGRLEEGGNFKPETLIYPSELRFKEWFDIHHRTSLNASFGWKQVINRRMNLGIFPGLTFQQGLLSTPFHRVFFTDNNIRVENLPRQRWKVPLGLQLNTFIGGNTIIRSYYRYYWDTFGIKAHTLQWRVPIKLNPTFSVVPNLRLYHQSGTRYFRPYYEHDPISEFYTSDHDLSDFQSIQLGIGLRYVPEVKLIFKQVINELGFNYVFYKRSDGLAFHMISLSIGSSSREEY